MTRLGLHKNEKPENEPIDLVVVKYGGEDLWVSPFFGRGIYNNNVAEMQRHYSHNSKDLGSHPRFTFRPATTSESVSIAAHDFDNWAKPEVFDLSWYQAGKATRTQDGVFTNIWETNEDRLKAMLNGAEEVNGIYLINPTIAFVPYESFQRGVQDAGDFSLNPKTNGLAKALEHTNRKPRNLAKISDKKLYELGVTVWGFDPTEEPVKRIVSFNSDEYSGGGRLYVNGDWDDGFASGVFQNVA